MTILGLRGAAGYWAASCAGSYAILAVAADLPDFDLTQPSRLWATLHALRPRVVVNTAAYTLVDRRSDRTGPVLGNQRTGCRRARGRVPAARLHASPDQYQLCFWPAPAAPPAAP